MHPCVIATLDPHNSSKPGSGVFGALPQSSRRNVKLSSPGFHSDRLSADLPSGNSRPNDT